MNRAYISTPHLTNIYPQDIITRIINILRVMTYSDSLMLILISIVISISLILRLMLHYIMSIFKNVDWILPSNLLTWAVFMLWSPNFHMITAFLCKFYCCLFYNYCFILATFISISYYTFFLRIIAYLFSAIL